MAVIDVAMVSWPNCRQRVAYMGETLASLEQLSASGYDLRFYCSIETEKDPKADWCGDKLEELLKSYGVIYQWREGSANLGANMNSAMRMGVGAFVYLQQDDWCLQYPLDLSPGANLLDAHRGLDIVRYSWPAAENMVPTFNGNLDGWRRISIRGKWPYGDDPHLRRRDFMDKWGWYYDQGKHGTASATLMETLVRGKASIVAADKIDYQHIGYASAVLGDVRSGKGRRYE